MQLSDGKQVGMLLTADVGLVGPGEPHERWKRTLASADWQKRARAILDGKTP